MCAHTNCTTATNNTDTIPTHMVFTVRNDSPPRQKVRIRSFLLCFSSSNNNSCRQAAAATSPQQGSIGTSPLTSRVKSRDVQEVRAVRRLGVVCGAWNLCRWLELRFSPWDTTNMSEHETKEPVEAVSNVVCDETGTSSRWFRI